MREGQGHRDGWSNFGGRKHVYKPLLNFLPPNFFAPPHPVYSFGSEQVGSLACLQEARRAFSPLTVKFLVSFSW